MARLAASFILALMVLTCGLAFAQHGEQGFHSGAPGEKVDYDGLFKAAEPLADSVTGRELLDACLETYGGREALAGITGLRVKMEMVAKKGSAPQAVEKTFQRGRLYRTSKGIDSRILNGTTCWYEHGEQTAELGDGRYRAELFSYLTLAMPLAAETEPFSEIRFGSRPDDSNRYFYFDKADSLMMVLGVDPDTHHIMSAEGIIRQKGQTLVFVNKFDDFRQVQGILFPHHWTHYSLGMRMGASVVKSVEIDPSFDAGEFLPRNKGD